MITDKNKERRQSHKEAKREVVVFTTRKEVKKKKDKLLEKTIRDMERKWNG